MDIYIYIYIYKYIDRQTLRLLDLPGPEGQVVKKLKLHNTGFGC